MGKRLLFKDRLEPNAHRDFACASLYTIMLVNEPSSAIALDQLKCTPRARHPSPAITTMQGALYFLARNVLYDYRTSSNPSIHEYIQRAIWDDATDRFLYLGHYENSRGTFHKSFTFFPDKNDFNFSKDKRNYSDLSGIKIKS